MRVNRYVLMVHILSTLHLFCLIYVHEKQQDEATFARMMRLVLNEWVAATIQLYFGKSTPENDSKYYAFVQVRAC